MKEENIKKKILQCCNILSKITTIIITTKFNIYFRFFECFTSYKVEKNEEKN
jgi:hypothetical protein